ncbi:mannosyl-oligosaccharide 1,2-alpha-mannosidase IA-like [Folsomia candida]|uniref:mannosyl-oligosaccharide 1,2-alpha-mannosidase IA-like n=1 Tax=Folsomia candida TaxID=158441 RepID=UPI0016053834|nr:mannosyl-oligosaccharide 1,2-alpha-mannosidase IA-like [Folsomia candida]
MLLLQPLGKIEKMGDTQVTENNEQKIVVLGETKEGRDPDPKMRRRRDTIRRMMVDAWGAYRYFAWGDNHVRPCSGQGDSGGVFGPGATIVDALDTLYIMGLEEQYEEGKDWIANQLVFENYPNDVSFFEMTIRYLGGLLALYSLTNDEVFLSTALSLGNKLLPVFQHESNPGLPLPYINLQTGIATYRNENDFILSEIGTLNLEFQYLSDASGNAMFSNLSRFLQENISPWKNGLYNNFVKALNPMIYPIRNGVSMGAYGDSFYEYLLKSYVMLGDAEALNAYHAAIDSFYKNNLIKKSVALKSCNYILPATCHLIQKLSKFIVKKYRNFMLYFLLNYIHLLAGMLALGSQHDPTALTYKKRQSPRAIRDLQLAKELARTCHENYVRTETHLGSEIFTFSHYNVTSEDFVITQDFAYKLRPEVVESYFVLWRVTGDPIYREWAWEVALAIEKHCKCKLTGGYSGISDVRNASSEKTDFQESFFLAETLKYLYLIFSSDNLLDLNLWVFNTEAHPLPIRNVNPKYKRFSSV